MATEHWFDDLHRTLTEEAPRRGLLRSASALMAGLALGAASQIGNAKKKKKAKKDKKKGKGKGNDKGKKDEKKDDLWGCEDRFQNLRIKDPNCSGGACNAHYPDDPCEEKYCEFICNQCDGDDPRDFCVRYHPSEHGKIAECCFEGEHCCEDKCCAADTHCCGNVCCPADWACHGDSCVPRDPDPDPDQCANCREPEWECCGDGRCIFRKNSDRENCGGCDIGCIPGERCHEGKCTHQCFAEVPQPCLVITGGGPVMDCIGADEVCCSGFSCPPGIACCGTTCGFVGGGCPG